MLGVILAAVAGPGAPAPETDLPLREVVGATIVMRFNGPELPGYVAEALRERRAAGVILFKDNAVTPPVTGQLTEAVREAGGPGAIISLDQEGGTIRIMPWAAPAQDQSQLPTPDAARAAAQEAVGALQDAGANLNLAPVADLSDPGSVMDSRAFPGDANAVAELVRTNIEAYEGTGIAATLKHFPGLGATDGNTDQVSVTIDRPKIAIKARDLRPFRTGIEAGAPAVMLSHALYPTLDPDRIASQSEPIVEGLLREGLGFEGVAMTDSLEAFAVRARSSVTTAAIRSMRAGVDLILTTGSGSHIAVQRAFRALARRDPGFRARLQEAAARVRTLQDELERG